MMTLAMTIPSIQQNLSLMSKDTGVHHNSPSDRQTQPQDELAMIPKEEEEEQEVEEQPDPTDQDTLVFDSEESKEEPFNTTIDTTSDDSAITMGKPVTTAFISNKSLNSNRKGRFLTSN